MLEKIAATVFVFGLLVFVHIFVMERRSIRSVWFRWGASMILPAWRQMTTMPVIAAIAANRFSPA